jgi:hypothetical protein
VSWWPPWRGTAPDDRSWQDDPVTDEWAPEDFEYDDLPRRRGLGVRVVAALVLLSLVAGLGAGVVMLLLG